MDIYVKVFGRVTCRDIELFKRHRAGETFDALAKSFDLSKQRCQQIYSRIEWKIKLFILLMREDIKRSQDNFIEKYNQKIQEAKERS